MKVLKHETDLDIAARRAKQFRGKDSEEQEQVEHDTWYDDNDYPDDGKKFWRDLVLMVSIGLSIVALIFGFVYVVVKVVGWIINLL
jgi:hypothetical protein